MKKLENKVTIVTGAGSGMGKEIAKLFVAEGSKVIATDIIQTRLDETKSEIEQMGGQVTTLLSNVTKEEDVQNMINVAVNTYGTLDILVNNAGVMDNFGLVHEVDDGLWKKVMGVNFEGPFRSMRYAIKNVFLPKGAGVIVNICSRGGLGGGEAGAAYTSSKWALVGLTKNTGFLYRNLGIRCNGIAPGAFQTTMNFEIDISKAGMAKDDVNYGAAMTEMGQPRGNCKGCITCKQRMILRS